MSQTKHPTPLAARRADHTLHVIAVISNPVRYRSRYALYEQFARHMLEHDVHLITVEAAFGDRAHVVTAAGHPDHIQVRTSHELWHKENLINIGLARLPSDWRYVAWIDADVQFKRPEWASETVQALQHHAVVQPFSDCIDLGPEGQAIEFHKSFAHQFVEKRELLERHGDRYDPSVLEFPHPGFAWAARREVIDALGGLLDWPILGSADHHMAWAFAGNVMRSHPGSLHPNYAKGLLAFQERCDRVVKRDLGYVPGTLLHHWHGSKRERRYVSRWQILQRHGFDPERDILKDSQGLYQLAGNKLGLRDDLRAYFRARNEDGISI